MVMTMTCLLTLYVYTRRFTPDGSDRTPSLFNHSEDYDGAVIIAIATIVIIVIIVIIIIFLVMITTIITIIVQVQKS